VGRLTFEIVVRRIATSSWLALALVACGGQDPAATSGASPPDAYAALLPPPSSGAPRFAAPALAPVLATGFEDASPQCEDWTSEAATAIRSIPAHMGDYACKLCATGEAPTLALAHDTGPLGAGRYVLTAWVRGRAPSAPSARAVLEAETSDGPLAREGVAVVPTDLYEPVRAVLDLAAPVPRLRARVEAAAAKDECVLVDDVALRTLR
jgi:hypothetical protein